MKVILNGYMTISEKLLTSKQKDQVLQAEPGHVKVLRILMMDENGKEIVLEGNLRKSKKGNLTAKFTANVNEFEVIEKKEIKKKKEVDETTKRLEF